LFKVQTYGNNEFKQLANFRKKLRTIVGFGMNVGPRGFGGWRGWENGPKLIER